MDEVVDVVVVIVISFSLPILPLSLQARRRIYA